VLFRKSKLLCPFCSNEFKPGTMNFRCLNEKCKVENDEALARYMELDQMLVNLVLPPPTTKKFYRSGVPWKTICSECKKETTQPICPGCHNALPPNFGREKAYTIALVGGSGVGKSNYIGVLINELQKKIFPRIQCNLIFKGEYSRLRYERDFRKPLFNDQKVVEPVVKTLLSDQNVRNPMFLRIIFPKKRQLGVRMVTPGVNLNFFDAAGDALRNAEKASVLAKYIGNANALVFLLDPLQSRTIRGKLIAAGIDEKRLPAEEDQCQIFNTIIDFFRRVKGIDERRPIKIPVAVAFSKSDALRNILPPNSAILKNSVFRNGIDMDEIETVDEEIRGHMLDVDDWNLEDVFTAVETSLANYKLFSFSALGDMPDARNQLHRGVVGIRVIDPVMWILYKAKILPGKTGVL
jgi:hypothetical protein